MNKLKILFRFIVLASLVVPVTFALADKPPQTPSQKRIDIFKRATVHLGGDPADADIFLGPRPINGFEPGAQIECNYLEPDPAEPMGGKTSKFQCALGKDKLKIKYGYDNGEVYAMTAGSRLFWALGFGASHVYPVKTLCLGCPADPWVQPDGPRGNHLFEHSIVVKSPFKKWEPEGVKGWAWSELDYLPDNKRAAKKEKRRRDSLKLLAAFVQHYDNKAEQQTIGCQDEKPKVDEKGKIIDCEKPLLFVHDIGASFASIPGRVVFKKMTLSYWKAQNVWKDTSSCTANIEPPILVFRGLNDPQISEEGRKHLSTRLGRLSDDQVRQIFHLSQVELRKEVVFDGERNRLVTVEDWLLAFREKQRQIDSVSCPKL